MPLGWNDPVPRVGHGAPWRARVVPAQLGVLLAPKFLVARSATLMLFNTFVHPQCERNDERRGEPCLSYRVHPSTVVKPENLAVHETSLAKEHPARKSKKEFWPAGKKTGTLASVGEAGATPKGRDAPRVKGRGRSRLAQGFGHVIFGCPLPPHLFPFLQVRSTAE